VKRRKNAFELNLTSLIDIVSIIILFLVLGGVFGVAELIVPGQIKLPELFSSKEIDQGLKVVLLDKNVEFSLWPQTQIPLAAFSSKEVDLRYPALKKKILKFLQAEEEKSIFTLSSKFISVIADEQTAYEELFPVLEYFRKSGFEQIQFLARNSSE